jgi:hypothetical protein
MRDTVLTPFPGRSRLLAAALAAALGAGCAAPRAQVAAEPPPPLTVPPPPPRIIVPPDPTPVPPVEEAPAPVAPARPRPQRPAPPRTDPTKTEPPKPADTDPAKAANGQEPPAAPAPTLEMQPGAGDARVRQQLDKAVEDLRNVNYAALSSDLKIQYDTAKRFITLGEQALREQNLMFAATLAEKAGAIATQLLRR